MAKQKYHFETLQLHAGQEQADPATGSRAVPIYQTTSYVFNDCQHASDLFALKATGNIYGRLNNPTQTAFEERIAALEGGVAGLAVASGAAAVTYAITNIAFAGDHVVASKTIYGGTYNLLAHTLSKYGISTTFFDPDNYEELEAAIRDNTRLVYIETLGNPNSNISDIERSADIAHRHGLPLLIDNTFGTPYLIRPIEHGADIVVHSATKFIGGHGTSLGGVIVDGGTFDWKADPGKFPGFNKPDASYHGLVFGDVPAPFATRVRTLLLRDQGAAISPFNAFLLLQGLETLALRMERHCSNALAVAQWLQKHPKVVGVNYAGLTDSPYHATARRICGGRASGILSFELKGGIEAGMRFIDALQLIYRLVNIGDAKTLACHPASTTHRQLNDEELARAGVPAGLVRLSIGIEDVDDILADIEQALAQA